jgi:hypothetical protein
MTDESKALKGLLEAAGWHPVILSENMRTVGISAVFTCEYASVAIVLAEAPAQVLNCWSLCQFQVDALRRQDAPEPWKDYYLLFVVNTIMDNAVGDLRDIINDTQVCRKIVLDRGGRDLRSVLADAPFLGVETVRQDGASAVMGADETLASTGLPDIVLVDLAKHSPDHVLNQLLAGHYTRGNSHENK